LYGGRIFKNHDKRKKLIGVSLEGRIREGLGKIWNGRKLRVRNF
jgi:hypothetical protein